MPIPNITFAISDGGLGRRDPSTDGVCGLVVTLDNNYANGDTVQGISRITSLAQAEANYITQANDIAAGCCVWHHIAEFFRINPGGTLWLYLVDEADLQEDIYAVDGHMADLLMAAQGEIKIAGSVLNPDGTYTPTISNALDADVYLAIAAAQTLAEAEFANHRPVRFVVEGRSFTNIPGNLTNLHTMQNDRVSVVIGNDYSITSTSGNNFLNSAAVGSVLGTLSRAAVHESITYVGRFNLETTGHFAAPTTSGGHLVNSSPDSWKNAIHDKGYILAVRYPNYPGTYWAGDHTCTALSSDFSTIQNTRTIDKSVMLVRTALMPLLGSPLEVDDQGKLAAETAKAFEERSRSALGVMLQDGEISALDAFVDPEQDVLATSEIQVRISIVPLGTAKKIIVKIGFTNQV